jgi:hypothetical protein
MVECFLKRPLKQILRCSRRGGSLLYIGYRQCPIDIKLHDRHFSLYVDFMSFLRININKGFDNDQQA